MALFRAQRNVAQGHETWSHHYARRTGNRATAIVAILHHTTVLEWKFVFQHQITAVQSGGQSAATHQTRPAQPQRGGKVVGSLSPPGFRRIFIDE